MKHEMLKITLGRRVEYKKSRRETALFMEFTKYPSLRRMRRQSLNKLEGKP